MKGLLQLIRWVASALIGLFFLAFAGLLGYRSSLKAATNINTPSGPTALVEGFYDRLDAEKGKTLVIFEDSAHWPMIEEKEKYRDLMVDVVLKESQNNR